MSFVIAPEVVQAAATDLAGIRSAILEASQSIAASTTAVAPAAADEISEAIAAMFGGLGQEFQVLSAQAQAFHAEFVKVLNSGVGAYVQTEIANAEQVLANAFAPPAASVAPAASVLDGLLGGGGGVLGTGGGLLGGTSGGLLGGLLGGTGGLLDTGALGGILGGLTNGSALSGLTSQLGQLGAGLQGLLGGTNLLPALQGLLPGLFGTGAPPDFFAAVAAPYQALFNNTIANLQNLGNAFAANPFPFLHQFISNQSSYGQIIASSFSQFAATGAVNDLLPIFSIPGRIGQNALNVFRTLTDFSYSVGVSTANGALSIGPAFFGLPIALGIDAIGSPVTTANAIASSAAAFMSAVQHGDAFGAAVAALTAPAVVANGFLNGQVTLALSVPPISLPILNQVGAITVPLSANVPFGGILTPLSSPTINVGPVVLGGVQVIPQLLAVPLGGTPTGGILPGLLLYLPQQLAQAIGAPPLIPPLLAPLPTIKVPFPLL
ncbi:PE family protein [Mycobacterium kubicae]|uniref:PE family protein n=1 Tax=Mycobacterium kubicae TaxID=120959 RepID=UPI00163DF635|nr:PE family protein [Mycobacterium kubicae]